VSRVDPVSSAVTTFPTGNAPTGVTVTPDARVWVGVTPAHPTSPGLSRERSSLHHAGGLAGRKRPGYRVERPAFRARVRHRGQALQLPRLGRARSRASRPEIAASRPRVSHQGGVWTYEIPVRNTYRFSPPRTRP
jgi:hypothetical protein